MSIHLRLHFCVYTPTEHAPYATEKLILDALPCKRSTEQGLQFGRNTSDHVLEALSRET